MRRIVATPLFDARLAALIDDYAERGATLLIKRLQKSYKDFISNIGQFDEIAIVKRRRVGGKVIDVRQYILDAGSRDFTVLYWVPPEDDEPILLLNIKIGGQNRFKWKLLKG
ncbi:MAG TPA: hypothetical protein VI298_09230 [Geobacteraceae bacterium]